MNTTTTQLLTENEVATLTGLSRGTLRTWRCRRKGPPYRKLGTRCLYDAAELAVWIAAQPHVRHAE